MPVQVMVGMPKASALMKACPKINLPARRSPAARWGHQRQSLDQEVDALFGMDPAEKEHHALAVQVGKTQKCSALLFRISGGAEVPCPPLLLADKPEGLPCQYPPCSGEQPARRRAALGISPGQ